MNVTIPQDYQSMFPRSKILNASVSSGSSKRIYADNSNYILLVATVGSATAQHSATLCIGTGDSVSNKTVTALKTGSNITVTAEAASGSTRAGFVVSNSGNGTARLAVLVLYDLGGTVDIES